MTLVPGVPSDSLFSYVMLHFKLTQNNRLCPRAVHLLLYLLYTQWFVSLKLCSFLDSPHFPLVTTSLFSVSLLYSFISEIPHISDNKGICLSVT